MNETVMIWSAVGVGCLVTAMLILLIRAFGTIRALSKKIRDYKDALDQVLAKQSLADKRMAAIETGDEKIKGSVEVLSTQLGSHQTLTDKRFSRLESGHEDVLVKAIHRLVEVVDNLCDRESEDWVGSAPEAVSERSKGISEDGIGRKAAELLSGRLCGADLDGDQVVIRDILHDQSAQREILEEFASRDFSDAGPDSADSDSEERDDSDSGIRDVSYHWIFPDRDSESRLVFGQWYLVVGESGDRMNADGSPMITSGEAMWNGYCFVGKGEEDIRYNKVYAYIKPPTSADVMEQVVSLALKKAG